MRSTGFCDSRSRTDCTMAGLDLLFLAPPKSCWSLNVWAGTNFLGVGCAISTSQSWLGTIFFHMTGNATWSNLSFPLEVICWHAPNNWTQKKLHWSGKPLNRFRDSFHPSGAYVYYQHHQHPHHLSHPVQSGCNGSVCSPVVQIYYDKRWES